MNEEVAHGKDKKITSKKNNLTFNILIGMLFGFVVGILIKISPASWHLQKYLIDGILNIGGTLFIRLIEMLVVPIVLVSLTVGICSLNDTDKLERIGIKSILLFLATTIIAIIFAVFFANILHIGFHMHLASVSNFHVSQIPSLKEFFINIVPDDVFKAMADANLLQIIVFAALLGITINFAGNHGKRIGAFLKDLNAIIMQMIMLVMKLAPVGVFCLIATLFAKLGFDVITNLMGYFLTVVLVLVIHTVVTYSLLLATLGKLSPRIFFRKMYSVMLFAFSVSSSNASIPLTLDTVEEKLGVNPVVSSFIIPLGVNINKNGAAIMQGVATIFIAHAYNLHMDIVVYLTILLTTILASVGSAGVPSGGIFALIMILKQLGLPLEGIGLILGIDRLLDMLRTVVNVLGNAVVACVVGKSEGQLDVKTYNSSSC